MRCMSSLVGLALISGFAVACGGATHDGPGSGPAGGGGSAGNAGSAGSAGQGGAGGATTGLADKVDLLVVVDNSISMADKQQMLAVGLPRFVDGLLGPPLDITDMHIGVITSSLGGHGGGVCSPEASPSPQTNDGAHLVPTVRDGALASFQNSGFLFWDASGKNGGTSNRSELVQGFAAHVLAAGEQGCGFEAPLEAMYRFLVDPAPPLEMVVNPATGLAEAKGVDQTVLSQRAAFLRPDSALVVVLLSDENDCSIVDGGINWLAAQSSNGAEPFHLPRGTAACASSPEDACCRSCALSEATPPPGCTALEADVECQKGPLSDSEDPPNLRCFEQKRRFGRSFLYPIERYVEGLTSAAIRDHWDAQGPAPGSKQVANPIFASGRAQNLVLVAGLIGVPWQDLVDGDSLSSTSELRLLTSNELEQQSRWSWLLGSETEPPADTLMVESVSPRKGASAATGEKLAPPSAAPWANSVNGHEWAPDGDLQYACIYPLSTPKDCTSATSGCDCGGAFPGYSEMSPLCQDPESGSYSSVQRAAKAYPGVRQLELLRAIGSHAVVASICPKRITGNATEPAFGYNAALDALANGLGGMLVADDGS